MFFSRTASEPLAGILRGTPKYSDDAESLLSQDSAVTEEESHRKKNISTRFILISVLTHLVVAMVSAWFSNLWRLDLNNTCVKHISKFSPVVKHVNIKFGDVQYNGSFFHENIYRKDPSPEVDDAWKALGIDYRALRVPEEEAEKSGIWGDQVKIKKEYGGGYPGNVEGLHHLHCLNLLRQTLRYNYDYYKKQGNGAFKNDEPVVKSHVTHCLDIIRQQLMCTVDTGVLGQVWINPKKPMPFVDFNTRHTCKNFDAIRQWAEEHQLPESTPKDFLEKPVNGGRIYGEIP